MSPEPLIALRDINSFYDKSHIIQGVSLAVDKGRCLCLLGRNGAGKTSILRSIMGLMRMRGGSIAFKGREIGGLKPHQISLAGIGYVPEDRQVFASLTVAENLLIGERPGTWTLDHVYDLFPRLWERERNRGNQLSGGEQQMLAIGRALMGNPELLLLDEPSEGLAPLVVQSLMDNIGLIKTNGLTIILVEQNVRPTYGVADDYCIIQQGRVVYTGTNQDFRSRPELMERYLGV